MNSCSRKLPHRALQGTLAFVAFGALSLSAALPAHADTGEIGYAEASIAGEGRIFADYPRGGDVGGYGGYLYDGEIWADTIHSILVDVEEDELFARLMYRELSLVLTEADVEAMREAAVDGVSQPGLENPEGEGSDEVVLEVTYTETDTRVAQNWAGETELSHDSGQESIEVNELGAEVSLVTESAPWTDRIRGVDYWGTTQNLVLIVDFPEEEFSVSYGVGETWVGADVPPADDGGDEDGEGEADNEDTGNGDGDGDTEEGDEGSEDTGAEGGEGNEGDPDTGKGEGDAPADEKSGKDDEDLARTGVPVLGLIAAGAAVAAGGGAAAYLARRKKNTVENSENSES